MNPDLLAARSLFEQPHRLTDVSFWHQHIPFAFLLTELASPSVFVELGTWKGDSYCAFCQAVATLNLPTRCYAVDTWEGDAHTGPYAPEVFEEFRSYHDPLYGAFSTLIRSTFEEARGHFEDGSVDLLHIDGHHSYASVNQDFQSWRDKLSDCGVVLFHDTNMRERDFGVWKLWDELTPHHPSFEFTHGHGLGILAIGPDPPPALLGFLEEANRRPSAVRRLFFALGEQVAARGRDERRDTALEALRAELEAARSELEGARSQLDALAVSQRELEAARAVLAALRARVETLDAELAARDALVTTLLRSRSWRVMAPIRALKPNVRRIGRSFRPGRKLPDGSREQGERSSPGPLHGP
jgi:hypothetical protein